MYIENCSVCLEPITNPVCVNCYIKEIYAWMQGMRIKEVPRNVVIEIIKRKLSFNTNNESECILCGNEDVGICSYCFFSMGERILKELNFSKKLIEDFNEIFNYHLAGDVNEYFEELKKPYRENEVRL